MNIRNNGNQNIHLWIHGLCIKHVFINYRHYVNHDFFPPNWLLLSCTEMFPEISVILEDVVNQKKNLPYEIAFSNICCQESLFGACDDGWIFDR